jgi:hypothetical protein
MLLRTLLAWLRDEPRVRSMVLAPSEAEEEARRAHREREDPIGERRSILSKSDGILATLGICGFEGLRRDRRRQLDELWQPDGATLPSAALSRVERLLDRLELVMTQIKTEEAARDAVAKKSATLLVRKAFREAFQSASARLYAGLTGTPLRAARWRVSRASARTAPGGCGRV